MEVSVEKMYKSGICAFAFLAVSFLLYKVIDVCQKKNTYIESYGVAIKEIACDNAWAAVTVQSNAKSVEKISQKHAEDVAKVKTFLLTKFDISEIEEKGDSVKKNNYYEMDSDLLTVTSTFEITTKKVDSICQLSAQSINFMKQGIFVNVNTQYFYKNLDKLITDLTLEAGIESKKNAIDMAKISGHKIVGLKKSPEPTIECNEDYYDISQYDNDLKKYGFNFPSKKVSVTVNSTYSIA